jgi:hypothetical protein
MEKKAIRLDLDTFNKIRIEQRQKDIKDALDNDIKLLSEVAKLESEEKAHLSRRRAELQKEMTLYREHLANQKAIELEREKELEKFYAGEQEKVSLYFFLSYIYIDLGY